MIIKSDQIGDVIYFLQYLMHNHGEKITVVSGIPVKYKPLYIQIKTKDAVRGSVVKEGNVTPFYFWVMAPVIPKNHKLDPYYVVYFKMT